MGTIPSETSLVDCPPVNWSMSDGCLRLLSQTLAQGVAHQFCQPFAVQFGAVMPLTAAFFASVSSGLVLLLVHDASIVPETADHSSLLHRDRRPAITQHPQGKIGAAYCYSERSSSEVRNLELIILANCISSGFREAE